MSQNIT